MKRARVLVYARVPDGDAGGVETAYRNISGELHGTWGLIGNELLRDCDDPTAFVVMSEWTSIEAFRDWEAGPEHRRQTSALRRYVHGAAVYQVVGAF
jgi:heme-degrading monooxygenase HmoA